MTFSSQSVLISLLCLQNFEETENTIPSAFLLCLIVKNCFAALFYIIYASNVECSFTAIILSCISPCLLTICSSKKSPVKLHLTSKIHSLKDHNKKLYVTQFALERFNLVPWDMLYYIIVGRGFLTSPSPYIAYLSFSKFCPIPNPLHLLPCFFDWMCDHNRSNVLFCLMILWT